MIATREPIKIDLGRELIYELFDQSVGQPRCEHTMRDESGEPYCGKSLVNGSEVSETRRMVILLHYNYITYKVQKGILFAYITKASQWINS
ncbi:MAG: hypothetical protein KJ718_01025 [Nanoarchaeota archaeon]|nr:hypothetical protein [Nanoarchaeota archaeon]MBU1051118.1 hypothetical protein [Nanoarchaeota archaeon]MBU1988408.1 hypothetical protein [Nanoarchaeota archaeon]